jgi:transposase
MINDFAQYAIYIMPGETDMRKQINGLAAIAENEMTEDIFSESLFLFCSRSRTQIKILYWDRNGFCLWQKRLEKYRFPWPAKESDYRNINYEELKMVLKGIDFFNAHKKLKNFKAS